MSAQQRVDRHIEGLRGVAVLAVVLHHAWPAALPGGFVGVDVFFVISGYLIGRHLIEDIRLERFSFRRFYARRMRRLFPALALVLAVTWCLGWQVLDAREFAELGRHTLAAVTFSNNVLLWQEAGYFDTAALAKPLRHLWSLAIEEQFYLLLPAVLWWGRRGTRAGVAWALGLGALSLAALALLGEIHPQAAFYLLPTRLWELVAGVGVGAFVMQQGPRIDLDTKLAPGQQVLTPTLAVAAAVAMAWGVWAYSPERGTGLDKVIPVAGSALLLALPATSALHRLLALPPLVFIGGISYPLYLWHWPLLVFWQLVHPAAPSLGIGLVLLAAFVLAWLTKVLVEDPIRFGGLAHKPVHRPALGGVAGGLACAGALGLGLGSTLGDGLPDRLPSSTQALVRWREDNVIPAWRVGTCFVWQNTDQPLAPECSPARRPGVARVLLWGDSHAAHLYAGLAGLQGQAAFDITQWTAGSCPPVDRALVGEGSHCARRRAEALAQLAAQAPDRAILSAAWTRYVRGGEPIDHLASTLTRTLHGLRQHGIRQVVLVGPGPSWPTSLPADLMRHMVRHRDGALPRHWGGIDTTPRAIDQALRTAAHTAGADYLSLLDLLCTADGCLTHTPAPAPGLPPELLFRDQDHLTRAGSLLVAQRARSTFLGARPPSRSETIPAWIPTPSSRPS